MRVRSPLDYVAQRWRSFLKSTDGNIALIFGIAIIPILTVVGVAIDYGRAATARSAMQAALDATALMIAKEAPGLTATQLNDKANAYFKALLINRDLIAPSLSTNYVVSPRSVSLTATATVNNLFMSKALLGGILFENLGASSTVKWSNTRYRVALVLDNTGSMENAGKMDELKKAAINLVNSFAGMASSADDVYISIVPFNAKINVGSANVGKSWISWDYWGYCKDYSGNPKYQYASKTACSAAAYRWTDYNKSDWNGCITDRDKFHTGDYDTKNTTPNPLISETLYDVTTYTPCPPTMIGLTSTYTSKSTLINKLNGMVPAGGTNQSIGLAMGWMTLQVGVGPFPAPAKSTAYNYTDIIIMLTDGKNSETRWVSCYDTDPDSCKDPIDARQKLLCDNMKSVSPSMQVFTIQVATDGDALQNVTKNCASKPEDPIYFNYITQASQIGEKFNGIFQQVSGLRLAK